MRRKPTNTTSRTIKWLKVAALLPLFQAGCDFSGVTQAAVAGALDAVTLNIFSSAQAVFLNLFRV
jgi:hypothetical protein